MSLNTLFDNGTHKVQSAGVVAEPEPIKLMSKLKFKQRMTAQERIAVRQAGEQDPVIFDFLDLVSDANHIDLSDQQTIDGINYLESNGHLAQGRADEILNNPVQPNEVP